MWDMFNTSEFWVALGQIIIVNIMLSGDNAVVIALASRSLPAHQQRKAIIFGSVGAIVLRVILTFFAVMLLKLPFLKLAGGAALLWIGAGLLPQVVQAVRVPVIAAGGVVDAATVRAALALGAAGVQAGTVFLCCTEARTSAVHRAALVGTAEGVGPHTEVTAAFTGRPARALVNRWARESPSVRDRLPPFPLAAGALAGLRQASEAAGRGDFSPLWAGQNTRACRTVPAAQIVAELADGFGDPVSGSAGSHARPSQPFQTLQPLPQRNA